VIRVDADMKVNLPASGLPVGVHRVEQDARASHLCGSGGAGMAVASPSATAMARRKSDVLTRRLASRRARRLPTLHDPLERGIHFVSLERCHPGYPRPFSIAPCI
jgi:hypothetical protein